MDRHNTENLFSFLVWRGPCLKLGEPELRQLLLPLCFIQKYWLTSPKEENVICLQNWTTYIKKTWRIFSILLMHQSQNPVWHIAHFYNSCIQYLPYMRNSSFNWQLEWFSNCVGFLQPCLSRLYCSFLPELIKDEMN